MSDWYSRLTNILRTNGVDQIDGLGATIAEIMAKLEKVNVPNPNTSLACCTTITQAEPASLAVHPYVTTMTQLKGSLEVATKQYRRLCLDCVRAEGESDVECRVAYD
jgi:hypothetical protein